jgi:hypothetical protein
MQICTIVSILHHVLAREFPWRLRRNAEADGNEWKALP